MSNQLLITEEKDRRNVHISSIFYGRVSVFHPAQRLTPSMMKRLTQVAALGGSDLDNPLESVNLRLSNTTYKIGLHVDYLLHGHRDVLETIIAYSRTVKCRDNDHQLNWLSVLSSVRGIRISNPEKEARTYISSDATVFSISMYELAIRLGITPHRNNYDIIAKRITQLSFAKISVSELDELGNSIDVKPFSFIDSFRLCYDPNKNKNNADATSRPNHIFVVLSEELVNAIVDNPAEHYRKDQYKITHYDSLPLRSCLKWLTTHAPSFLHTKRLDWILDHYIASLATPVCASFKSKLRKEFLKNTQNILLDYNLDIRLKKGTKKLYQFFYIKE